jgi:pentatricopeptide repeat domain-containing protein 1
MLHVNTRRCLIQTLRCYSAALVVKKEPVAYATKVFGKELQQKADDNETLTEAIQMFERFGHKNTITFNIIINSLYKNGKIQEGEQFFNRYSGLVRPDVRTFNSMIEAHLKNQRRTEAAQILHDMQKEYHITPNDYTYRLFIYAASTPEEALEQYKSLDQKTQLLSTFIQTLMRRLIDLGAIDHALDVFYSLLTRNVSPDEFVFSTLIHELYKLKRFYEGKYIFYTMQQLGMRPNVVIYTTMINYYFKEQKFRQGRLLLTRMVEDKVSPNVQTFNCMIDGYMKARRFDLAQQVFEEMLACNVKPTDVIFSTMTKGYTAHNRPDGIQKVEKLKEKYL